VAERSFARAFADAIDGIATTLREQRNFRVQLAIGIAVAIAAALLRFDAVRWAVLVLAIGAVLAAELFNTSLERAVDCASPGTSQAARAAKHAGAGAVLATSVAAALAGAILFGTALWSRVHGAP